VGQHVALGQKALFLGRCPRCFSSTTYVYTDLPARRAASTSRRVNAAAAGFGPIAIAMGYEAHHQVGRCGHAFALVQWRTRQGWGTHKARVSIPRRRQRNRR
jgi:hypothetical protein